MIKTRLQLVCCALVWEPGCLGISESWKEGVSGVGVTISFLVPFLSPFAPLHFSIFSLNFLLFHLHSLTVHT